MSKTIPTLRLLTCALLLGAVAQAQAQTARPAAPPAARGATAPLEMADYIVALVNSEPVTYKQVLIHIQRTEQRLRAGGAQVPSKQVLQRETLERLINERVMIQTAKEIGLKVSAPELDAAIASIAAQNNIAMPQLLEQLRKERVNIAQFRSDIGDELLIMKLRERELEGRAFVNDTELDEYLRQQNALPASVGLEVNLAQILIAVPEGADEATIQSRQQQAQALRDRLKAGENFSKLAMEFSQADKAAGNAMGLKSVSRYPQIFVDAAAPLQPGEISELVRSGAGFHIIKLLERGREGMPSQSIQQTQVRHILIKPSQNMPEARARQLLTDVRSRILAKTATFEAMARQYSQDGSSDEGGNLGWVGPGQFVPEFENVMNQLAEGTVSEPIPSRFGLHLIQVTGRRTHKVSQQEFREMVRQTLRERKIEETYPRWVQELRSTSYVEYRPAPEQ
jgi:peptidyl-prolyl cis-trans isomerase SurA